MMTSVRRLIVTGPQSAAMASAVATSPGQATNPSMMTRPMLVAQRRAMQLATLQRRPETAVRNAPMMALQRPDEALTSALQKVNALTAALICM